MKNTIFLTFFRIVLVVTILFGTQSVSKSQTLTDLDGNTYKTVVIGNQEWTVENWQSTKYNDGTPIPIIADNTQWGKDIRGAMCYYDNDVKNKYIYGGLYNYMAVKTGKIAPEGWRVPSNEDWSKLRNYLIFENIDFIYSNFFTLVKKPLLPIYFEKKQSNGKFKKIKLKDLALIPPKEFVELIITNQIKTYYLDPSISILIPIKTYINTLSLINYIASYIIEINQKDAIWFTNRLLKKPIELTNIITNTTSINTSGFSALPGGLREDSNFFCEFMYMNFRAYWWSSSSWNRTGEKAPHSSIIPHFSVDAWNGAIDLLKNDGLEFEYYSPRCGMSIRLVRDL